MKKMLAGLLVAGIVVIPVGAYAAGALDAKDGTPAAVSAAEEKFGLADNVYGSFATMKKAWPNAKMEDYKRFNDKLESAKAQLGDEEYARFEELVKQMAAFGLKYPGKENSMVDMSKMSAEEAAEYEKVVAELGVYFERLNG